MSVSPNRDVHHHIGRPEQRLPDVEGGRGRPDLLVVLNRLDQALVDRAMPGGFVGVHRHRAAHALHHLRPRPVVLEQPLKPVGGLVFRRTLRKQRPGAQRRRVLFERHHITLTRTAAAALGR